jgi:hypothetical protein
MLRTLDNRIINIRYTYTFLTLTPKESLKYSCKTQKHFTSLTWSIFIRTINPSDQSPSRLSVFNYLVYYDTQCRKGQYIFRLYLIKYLSILNNRRNKIVRNPSVYRLWFADYLLTLLTTAVVKYEDACLFSAHYVNSTINYPNATIV